MLFLIVVLVLNVRAALIVIPLPDGRAITNIIPYSHYIKVRVIDMNHNYANLLTLLPKDYPNCLGLKDALPLTFMYGWGKYYLVHYNTTSANIDVVLCKPSELGDIKPIIRAIQKGDSKGISLPISIANGRGIYVFISLEHLFQTLLYERVSATVIMDNGVLFGSISNDSPIYTMLRYRDSLLMLFEPAGFNELDLVEHNLTSNSLRIIYRFHQPIFDIKACDSTLAVLTKAPEGLEIKIGKVDRDKFNIEKIKRLDVDADHASQSFTRDCKYLAILYKEKSNAHVALLNTSDLSVIGSKEVRVSGIPIALALQGSELSAITLIKSDDVFFQDSSTNPIDVAYISLSDLLPKKYLLELLKLRRNVHELGSYEYYMILPPKRGQSLLKRIEDVKDVWNNITLVIKTMFALLKYKSSSELVESATELINRAINETEPLLDVLNTSSSIRLEKVNAEIIRNLNKGCNITFSKNFLHNTPHFILSTAELCSKSTAESVAELLYEGFLRCLTLSNVTRLNVTGALQCVDVRKQLEALASNVSQLLFFLKNLVVLHFINSEKEFASKRYLSDSTLGLLLSDVRKLDKLLRILASMNITVKQGKMFNLETLLPPIKVRKECSPPSSLLELDHLINLFKANNLDTTLRPDSIVEGALKGWLAHSYVICKDKNETVIEYFPLRRNSIPVVELGNNTLLIGDGKDLRIISLINGTMKSYLLNSSIWKAIHLGRDYIVATSEGIYLVSLSGLKKLITIHKSGYYYARYLDEELIAPNQVSICYYFYTHYGTNVTCFLLDSRGNVIRSYTRAFRKILSNVLLLDNYTIVSYSTSSTVYYNAVEIAQVPGTIKSALCSRLLVATDNENGTTIFYFLGYKKVRPLWILNVYDDLVWRGDICNYVFLKKSKRLLDIFGNYYTLNMLPRGDMKIYRNGSKLVMLEIFPDSDGRSLIGKVVIKITEVDLKEPVLGQERIKKVRILNGDTYLSYLSCLINLMNPNMCYDIVKSEKDALVVKLKHGVYWKNSIYANITLAFINKANDTLHIEIQKALRLELPPGSSRVLRIKHVPIYLTHYKILPILIEYQSSPYLRLYNTVLVNNSRDSLKEVLVKNVEGFVEALSTSPKYLAVAFNNITFEPNNSILHNGHIYILDINGSLVEQYNVKGEMEDASYCCNKFGFVNLDDYAYIYDLSTGTWKKVYVGDDYDRAITMLKNGFLAGCCNLAYFDFQGHKRWDVSMNYIVNGPAVYKGYVYVPQYAGTMNALRILKLSDGGEVRTIEFNERVLDAQVCGNYLALGTAHHVYLYDISDPTNPRELWNYNGIARSCNGGYCYGAWNVAFSPDCKYLVSADYEDQKIHLFDVQTGKQVLERRFESSVGEVAWWRNRIAVGLENGKVYVFKLIIPPITSKK
ncbi:hypothetical protein IPA_01165 [Ignicoccus pacificus DSM 13166]|uniref:Uncharacterized protein n=1 Tax=Ignicoccus pacificus DSM 13166 TaxID=940294 RepID=A0A977KAG2_9CREN|nr:hypothetical protein IPA_01165 [Ignicoccus pacificus DSM 13166]